MNHIVEFHNVLHILLYCHINGVMIINVVASIFQPLHETTCHILLGNISNLMMQVNVLQFLNINNLFPT
jgi:hypothetical protein